MRFAESGQTLVIGDPSVAQTIPSSITIQVACTLVFGAICCTLLLIDGTDPNISQQLKLFFFICVVIGCCLVWLLLGFLRSLSASSEARFVRLDRTRSMIEVFEDSGFGLRKSEVPFDEISEIDLVRGDWAGPSASCLGVLRRAGHSAIVLPQSLDDFEMLILASFLSDEESSVMFHED